MEPKSLLSFLGFALMNEPSPAEETPTTEEDHEMQLKWRKGYKINGEDYFFPSLRINIY